MPRISALNQPDTTVLKELASHLLSIDELLSGAGIAALVGQGIRAEITYAVSGFRQRFPELFESEGNAL